MNIPGDELAMLRGYREMVTKTLDELCMSPGKHLSQLMMCGLDCPCWSPFLFVTLGGGVAIWLLLTRTETAGSRGDSSAD